MKTLIIYDSVYGNTEKIARAVADAFPASDILVKRPGQLNPGELNGLDILILGAPTQGGRPTETVQGFLDSLHRGALERVSVAAFDTRMSGQDVGGGLRILMGVIGFAAGRMAKVLQQKGGRLLVPPEGFIVMGREGPLREGEVERALEWGKIILKASSGKQ